MDYQLEAVWPAPGPEVMRDVVRFWISESAMPDSVAGQRAPQLLVVARTPEREVAAVSTAIRKYVDQLGFECFYYRSFVGHQHRAQGLLRSNLARIVMRKSFDVLESRFLSGIDASVLGLYLEVENPKLMRVLDHAVWRDLAANVVYIGRTPQGHDQRVWYFEGARVPHKPRNR
jgi:hypothetical protein